eukprot:Hpha_TRINITY_DN15123_c3_g3::TRINITY_DN15123_c3_g3_i1::g.127379::m.127379
MLPSPVTSPWSDGPGARAALQGLVLREAAADARDGELDEQARFVGEVFTRAEAVRAELDAAGTALHQREVRVAAHEALQGQTQEELRALRQDVEDAEVRLGKASESLALMQHELSNAVSERDTAKQRAFVVAPLRAELEHSNQEVAALRRQVELAREQRRRAGVALREEQEKRSVEREASERELVSLRKALEESRRERTRAEELSQTNQRLADNAEERSAAALSRLQELEQEVEALAKAALTQVTEEKRQERERQKLQHDLNLAQEEGRDLSRRLSEREGALRELAAKVRLLEGEKTGVEDAVALVREEAALLREESRATQACADRARESEDRHWAALRSAAAEMEAVLQSVSTGELPQEHQDDVVRSPSLHRRESHQTTTRSPSLHRRESHQTTGRSKFELLLEAAQRRAHELEAELDTRSRDLSTVSEALEASKAQLIVQEQALVAEQKTLSAVQQAASAQASRTEELASELGRLQSLLQSVGETRDVLKARVDDECSRADRQSAETIRLQELLQAATEKAEASRVRIEALTADTARVSAAAEAGEEHRERAHRLELEEARLRITLEQTTEREKSLRRQIEGLEHTAAERENALSEASLKQRELEEKLHESSANQRVLEEKLQQQQQQQREDKLRQQQLQEQLQEQLQQAKDLQQQLLQQHLQQQQLSTEQQQQQQRLSSSQAPQAQDAGIAAAQPAEQEAGMEEPGGATASPSAEAASPAGNPAPPVRETPRPAPKTPSRTGRPGVSHTSSTYCRPRATTSPVRRSPATEVEASAAWRALMQRVSVPRPVHSPGVHR